jgi:hypothetical protein
MVLYWFRIYSKKNNVSQSQCYLAKPAGGMPATGGHNDT